MFFYCTKGLVDKLKKCDVAILPAEACEDKSNGLFSWYCNLIKVDGSNVMVCVNQLTRYAVVFNRPKVKDFENIEELFFQGLRVALTREGFTNEIIEEYISRCGEAKFTSIANRKFMGYMNAACREVKRFSNLLCSDSVVQEKIGLYSNYYYIMRGDGEYADNHKLPRTFMAWAMCEMIGKDKDYLPEIFGHQMYQLKIELDLGKHQVWRRIVIPSRATFYDLHQAIQKSFDWHGRHCHDFSLFDGENAYDDLDKLQYNKIKMKIFDGCDMESEAYLIPGIESKRDIETVLFEVFEKVDQCLYVYDFGDNWRHVITLEKVIEGNQDKQIKLIERFGDRPPEDVGGKDGYENYLEAIADVNHPEHEEMVKWSQGHKERVMCIDEVNLSMQLYGWF